MLDANKPSHFPFFSELNARGRSRLLGATRHVRLPPYAKVIERGDEVAGVYLVEAGALRIYYVSSEGREGTLYWVDPGQACITPSIASLLDCLIQPGSRQIRPTPRSRSFPATCIANFTLQSLPSSTSRLQLYQLGSSN